MTLKRFATALRILTAFVFFGLLPSLAPAQVISLTIDSAQSSVAIELNGDDSSSQLSGDLTLDLQSSNPPSGSAQITGLDLVLDDAINFSFVFGTITASSSPGDVTVSLVTPGPAGTISGNAFDQLANSLELGGELDVSLPFQPSQTFDLADITLGPANFTSVNVTQSGNVITISGSASITEMVDLGFGLVPLVVDLTYVANGTAPDPFLLGDVNLDNAVDFLDIGPFIALLSSGGFQDEADIDRSTVVDFLDIGPFIMLLSGP